jgi:hypothetical protein
MRTKEQQRRAAAIARAQWKRNLDRRQFTSIVRPWLMLLGSIDPGFLDTVRGHLTRLSEPTE